MCLKLYLCYGIAVLLDVALKLDICLANVLPVEYCCWYWEEVCMPPYTVHFYCVLCTLLVCNVCYTLNSICVVVMKANELHYFSYLFDKVLYLFRTCPLSIIRSISTLYTQ